jgi:glycine/D-amino acid oxidase-like deaminating enzyme
MIYSDQSPVTFTAELPAAVDVVVVGGGVIGVSTAWFLARGGQSVLLCDKGRIAGEQSSRNWGWVRQQGRDPAELPIMMESNRIWQGLAQEIGCDVGFRQHGVLYIAENETEMQEHEEWVRLASEHDLESLLLSAGEVRERLPALKGEWLGGVITPSDGRAEPSEMVPAMARDCVRRGVAVVENCAVRGIETRAGQVSSVVTEQGVVGCDNVVVAGGAWSSLFLGNLGIRFPQLTIKSTVARTAPVEDFYPGNASIRGLAFRRRQDGGYTIAPSGVHEHTINRDSFRFAWPFRHVLRQSWQQTRLRIGTESPGGRFPPGRWALDQVTPFERQRVLNPVPDSSLLQSLGARFGERFPSLAGTSLAESWAGLIDATPDVVPVMDRVNRIPGLFLASGFSGHGFGIGPAAGRIMADLVQGNSPGHDLHRFRFPRFSDGSPIVPGPAL